MRKDVMRRVLQVQRLRPGWRFMLLGGDTQMGYKLNKDGSLKRSGRARMIIVDESSRVPFGWKAEFFGEMDPRHDYGDRHVRVSRISLEDAIEVACNIAMRKIREEDAKRKPRPQGRGSRGGKA